MLPIIRIDFVILSLGLIVPLLSACDKTLPPLKIAVNDRFPMLVLKDLHGGSHTINPVTDKITLLNVWATWCGPCRHEMPSLDRLNNKLQNDGFQVIGISVDHDDHVVREFLIERKIHFANFMQSEANDVIQLLGIRAFPSTFIVGRDGRLLSVIEGWRDWESEEILQMLHSLNVKSTV